MDKSLIFSFLCSHLENKYRRMRHLSHKIRTLDINRGPGIQNKMNTKSLYMSNSKSILVTLLAELLSCQSLNVYQKSAKRSKKTEEFARHVFYGQSSE